MLGVSAAGALHAALVAGVAVLLAAAFVALVASLVVDGDVVGVWLCLALLAAVGVALTSCAPVPACDDGVARAERAIDLARVADTLRQYPTVQGALNGTQRVLQSAARPAPRCPAR